MTPHEATRGRHRHHPLACRCRRADHQRAHCQTPYHLGRDLCFVVPHAGPDQVAWSLCCRHKHSDRVFRFRLAMRAFLFSIGAVAIAASLGGRMLDNFAIPAPVLQIAVSLIPFLVALQAVMQQYSAAHPPERTEPPRLALASSPLLSL